MRNKIFVIGLDGATFDILDPLLEAGNLPNIRNIIETGVRGILLSTFPPVTGPAWTALATGKNPGKTGVFDSLHTRSQAIRKAKPYWDYLSRNRARIAVANYPFLYPPYEINGIMISGLGSDPEGEISYPGEFKGKLIEKCGQYRIQPPLAASEYLKNPNLFVEHMLALLEINEKTLELLLEIDLDVLTFVISASDFAQHQMWQYIDTTHPRYREDEARKYHPMFVQIWERIDEIIGSAIRGMPDNTNIMIASDHGFGPHRSTFYTNSWLEAEGYLSKRKGMSRIRRLEIASAQLARSISPSIYTRLIKAANTGRIPKISAKDDIDLEKSLAYSPVNASLVGEICVNKESKSITNDPAGFDTTREQIIRKLEETCHGMGIRVNIFDPHELYQGQYAHTAPDILFEIESGECEIQYGFGETIFCQPPIDMIHGGSHKKEGIVIACGPDIKQGQRIEAVNIYDVAPTILHLAGLPVPSDMDGRVLNEIIREDGEAAKREIKYTEIDTMHKELRDRINKMKMIGRL